MGILYLVRHGQANSSGLHTSNVADGAMESTYDQLTSLGYEQAAATGRSLASRISAPHPLVLSGPLGRQLNTAQSIHKELTSAGLKPEAVDTVEQWREFNSDEVLAPYLRTHPEVLAEIRQAYAIARDEGTPQAKKEHNRLLGRAIDTALQQWRSGSGFEGFAEQVKQGFSNAVSLSSEHESVVVVTSGGPISLCTAELIGADWTRLINNLFTASVSVFSVRSAGKAQLLSFNEHAHLDLPDASGKRPLRHYR